MEAFEINPNPGVLPSTPPPDFNTEPDDSRLREQIPGEVRRGDQLEAAYELSKSEAWTNLFGQEVVRREQAKNGKKLTPQELNELYPELDEKFNSPFTHVEAQSIVDRYHERRRLESIIQSGPSDAVSWVGNLGAALMAHVTDPLELVANVGMTAGLGYLGRAAGLGSRFAKLGRAERAALGVFAENVVSQAALEPVHQYMTKDELQEQTVADVFHSIALSSVGFSALHYGVHRLARLFPERTEGLAHESAVGQLVSDRRPQVEPILDAAIDTKRVTPKGIYDGQRVPYEFRVLDDADIKGRGFYHGTGVMVTDILKSDRLPVGEDLGNGLYLTDNPNVANGVGGAAGSSADGAVFQVGVENLRLIDLDKPAVGPIKELLREQLAKALGDGMPNYAAADRYLNAKPFFQRSFSALADHTVALTEPSLAANRGLSGGRSLREAMDVLREAIADNRIEREVFDDLAHLLSEAGYDGYRHSGGNPYDLDSQNVIMLFDPEKSVKDGKLQALDVQPANKSAVGNPSAEAVRQFGEERNSYRAGIDHDPDEFRKFEELEAMPKPQPTGDYVQQLEDQAIAALDQMEKLGHLTEEDVAALESIKAARAEHTQYEKILQTAASCVGVE